MRAGRPCNVPGCPALATRGGRCAWHQPLEKPRLTAKQRGYGGEWRAIRAAQLRKYPMCAVCGAVATDVDHIVPLARGGTHDVSNLQSLCHAHHSRKTATRDGGWGR